MSYLYIFYTFFHLPNEKTYITKITRQTQIKPIKENDCRYRSQSKKIKIDESIAGKETLAASYSVKAIAAISFLKTPSFLAQFECCHVLRPTVENGSFDNN